MAVAWLRAKGIIEKAGEMPPEYENLFRSFYELGYHDGAIGGVKQCVKQVAEITRTSPVFGGATRPATGSAKTR